MRAIVPHGFLELSVEGTADGNMVDLGASHALNELAESIIPRPSQAQRTTTYSKFQAFGHRLRELRSNMLHKNTHLKESHGAEASKGLRPKMAKSMSSISTGTTESSSVSSGSHYHSSGRTLTKTDTSSSTSQAGIARSVLTVPELTQELSSCSICKASNSGRREDE